MGAKQPQPSPLQQSSATFANVKAAQDAAARTLADLWIVGKTTRYRELHEDGGSSWEFQGVFDSESGAIAACRDARYWIAPVRLNQELPDEPMYAPGAYHPLAKPHAPPPPPPKK